MQGSMIKKDFLTMQIHTKKNLQKRQRFSIGEDPRPHPNEPSQSPEERAERERTMKEAIEIANRKYGAPTNEIIKKKKKDPDRQALEKLFAPHTALETDAMKYIKERMEKYAQEMTERRTGIDALRFQNRKDLFKIICIAIAELRSKKLEPLDEMETFLLNPNIDYYGYASVIVNTLEIHLFKNLFRENVKSRDEPYQVKIKILRSQLNDKTNFRLRRGVVNKTLSFEYLEKATEEDLKSDERKMEEKQLMERLVRESQSWDDVGYQKQIKYDDTQAPNEHEERKKPEIENIELSDDEESVEKKKQMELYQEATKNLYEVFQKQKSEMQRRIVKLGDSKKKLQKNWQAIWQRE